MMDRNTSEPPRKRSFFDDDSMDNPQEGQGRRNMMRGQDPRMDSVSEEERLPPRTMRSDLNGRERMTSRYRDEEDDEDYNDEDGYDRRSHSRFAFMQNLFHGDPSTRRLAYAAAGIGGILLLFIGGWMMSHVGNRGIPVFEPPQIAAKEKPLPESNSDIIGMDKAEGQMDANGKPILAPGPEQADPSALAAQYGSGNPANGQGAGTVNTNSNASNNTVPPLNHNQPILAPSSGSSNEMRVKGKESTESAQSGGHEATASEESGETEEAPPVPVKKHVQPQTTNKKSVSSKKEEKNNQGNGHFIVQLAALGSSSAAQKQWQFMRKKAPELLGKYTPSLQKAEIKGNTIYRIRIKGFSSKAQASSFCSQLKAKSLSCTLANF